MVEVLEKVSSTAVVKFNVTDEHLAEMRQRMSGLTCATPADYELTRKSIAECRELRVAVEARRKELKEDALKWGRLVDSEAKRITAELESIENPLKEMKKAVDDEAERVRQEKADAIRRQHEEAAAKKLAEEQARLKAEREAEEARLAEQRRILEEEQAKLRAAREAQEEAARIEREKIEAERRAIEEERAKAAAAEAARLAQARAEQEARDKAEREKIEAERAAVEAERLRLEQEEAIRQAKIRAEQEAREQLERERIAEQERQIAEQKRQQELAALRPDIEKVAEFAATLRAIEAPKVKSTKVRGRLNEAIEGVRAIADGLAKAEF